MLIYLKKRVKKYGDSIEKPNKSTGRKKSDELEQFKWVHDLFKMNKLQAFHRKSVEEITPDGNEKTVREIEEKLMI